MVNVVGVVVVVGGGDRGGIFRGGMVKAEDLDLAESEVGPETDNFI